MMNRTEFINTDGIYITGEGGDKIVFFKPTVTPSRKLKRERLNVRILSETGGNKIYRSVIDATGLIMEKPFRITKFEFPIEVFGDTFYFSRDSEGFFIFHKSWSLLGEGRDLKDAVEDLRQTIRELRSQLFRAKIEELDRSAVEFREYLLSQLNA